MAFLKRKKSKNRTVGEQQNSQRVISYYTASKRQVENFDRQNRQTQAEKNNRKGSNLNKIWSFFTHSWFSVFVFFALGAIFVYSLFLSAVPAVVVEGPAYRSQQEYASIIAGQLKGDIRNRTKPFIQTSQLESSIAEAIPEAKQIRISTSLIGGSPTVKVINDPAIARVVDPSGSEIILSERGRLLLPTTDTDGEFSTLPSIKNTTTVELKPGDQFISPLETKAYSLLMNQFKSNGDVPQAEITVTPREILVNQQGSRGNYTVRFLLDDETILQQYGAMRATQNKLKSQNQQPKEYIDVRLAEKVFYK
jgi:hypothetical protein